MNALTPLQLLQAHSLPSLVQAEIEQMILRGELCAGQRINEVELAEHFRTSRGPVREALDELIGRRLAEHITAPQLATLRALLADMDAATARQDVRRYHELNLTFHEALVDFVGNARLAETYRRLTKELLLFRLRGLQDGGGFAVSNAEHKAIVKAIASRDPERAGRVLRAHAADSRARMHRAAAAAPVARLKSK